MQDLIWAIPAVLFSAILIGWAAETAEKYVSQGLALAVLAWLQTLPEFAVEANLAWNQKQDLMIANLTGSLRLLTGLGWPLIYFTFLIFGRKRMKAKTVDPVIYLKKENSLEVFGLLVSTIYFVFIAVKGSLTVPDAVILILFYVVYLYRLSKMAKGEHEPEEDTPWVTKKIVAIRSGRIRTIMIVALFFAGGLLLNYAVEPFLHGLERAAFAMGISTFVFIQWISPFVSEFPEKVTAFQWAATGKRAPLALLNMISSNIVQWTLMAGLLPIIYSVSKGSITPIFFDRLQVHEILLTVVQSFLAILYLMKLEIRYANALTLYTLWLVQFCLPKLREEMIAVYILFILVEVVLLIRQKKLFYALKVMRDLNEKA